MMNTVKKVHTLYMISSHWLRMGGGSPDLKYDVKQNIEIDMYISGPS